MIRSLLNIIINNAYKKSISIKKIFPKSKKLIKEEEELKRLKDNIPIAHSQLKMQNSNANFKDERPIYEIIEKEKENQIETEIVDVIKPIGFWTSMILGQKLTYLVQSAQILNKKGSKGFWVSMIEAKDRQAGKQHSRTR